MVQNFDHGVPVGCAGETKTHKEAAAASSLVPFLMSFLAQPGISKTNTKSSRLPPSLKLWWAGRRNDTVKV